MLSVAQPPSSSTSAAPSKASASGKQKQQDKNVNLPWVEKYRPAKLEDLISHVDIITTLNKFISENRLPHLLFYGPPGTGKTSTILACAKQMYTPEEAATMVLELNASDDRGINVVRERIIQFASSRILSGTVSGKLKMIVLDEADAMTRDAQNALRRVIEKYTPSVRFCLICNYLSKIIPAIQSRCTRFRFAPLSPEQMLPRLKHVVAEEKVEITEDGEKALITLAHGDMRRTINVLQSTCMAFGLVNERNVYLCVGHPLREDVELCLNHLLNSSVNDAYNGIRQIQQEKGLALQDIIYELHNYVHRLDMPAHMHVMMLNKMSDIEYRLCEGATDAIQLSALIAAAHFMRRMAETHVDAHDTPLPANQ